jgi:hypothetical protein
MMEEDENNDCQFKNKGEEQQAETNIMDMKRKGNENTNIEQVQKKPRGENKLDMVKYFANVDLKVEMNRFLRTCFLYFSIFFLREIHGVYFILVHKF